MKDFNADRAYEQGWEDALRTAAERIRAYRGDPPILDAEDAAIDDVLHLVEDLT